MAMSATPAAERVHIAFFGKRNAGKSSIMNAVTGQQLAVVSDIKGTTTDPVFKTMELLPIGPVVMIDTPGIDDHGELGRLRVKKSFQILNKTDLAVLVTDIREELSEIEEELIERFRNKQIPYLIVYNKRDLVDEEHNPAHQIDDHVLFASAVSGQGIEALKEAISRLAKIEENPLRIVGDLVAPNDFVVLVVPIDSAAPKGRLILPQQQTIRDLLEVNAAAIVVRETELADTLAQLGKKPALVITDSQAFGQVSKDTPNDVMLTSFSILFARYKGNLHQAVKGVKALETLKPGAKILIAEGCTHHRQCEDIGTVKLPAWIREYTKTTPQFDFCSGTEFPDDLSGYDLIVHCGACMLNQREMKYRQQCALDQAVPMTNYGILIAHIHGILKRSLEPFPEILKEL